MEKVKRYGRNNDMSTKLTKKQKGFVKDYIDTGVGEVAATKNYDVSTDNSARVIASQNLTKLNIQEAIDKALPDELLAEKHLALLNKQEVVTKNNMTTGEVDTIPTGEIDVQAVKSGLDMAYKLKGSYAPDKSIGLKLNIEARNSDNPEIDALIEEYDKKLKAKLTK